VKKVIRVYDDLIEGMMKYYRLEDRGLIIKYLKNYEFVIKLNNNSNLSHSSQE